MRENRTYGSEGGVSVMIAPLPLSSISRHESVFACHGPCLQLRPFSKRLYSIPSLYKNLLLWFILQSRNAIVPDGQTYESRLYKRFKYIFSIYLNTKAGTDQSSPDLRADSDPSISQLGSVFACHGPCLQLRPFSKHLYSIPSLHKNLLLCFILQSRNAIVPDGQTYESRLYKRFKYMFSIYLNTKAGTDQSSPDLRADSDPSISRHESVFA